jgi:hypothetical protein
MAQYRRASELDPMFVHRGPHAWMARSPSIRPGPCPLAAAALASRDRLPLPGVFKADTRPPQRPLAARPIPEALMMSIPWKRYVSRLCADVWALDALATEKLLVRMEALAAAGELTDSAVARVLHRSGIAASAADRIAPSIRVAIGA